MLLRATSSAVTWTLWTGACALAACNALVGNTDVRLVESDASTADGTADDGAAADGAANDATGHTDGAEAGPDGPATVYNDVTLPANWSAFDLNGLGSAYTGFVGGAFDGRYVYLSPNHGTVVVRYDTTAPFADATSWATFDSSNADPNTGGFGGATFAPPYVYFPPEQQATVTPPDAASYTVYGGVLARYDSSRPFDAASSWATFDMTTIDPNAVGYVGAAFDGTYLYFSQHEGNSNNDDLISRFDTRGQLDTGSSWLTYSTGSFSAASGATTGAVFDGRYVYFGGDDTGQGVMEQYDTTGPFNASWAAFDQTTLNSGANGYSGQAFDGRYVYFVPGVNNIGPHGLALRCDPKGVFTAASSWKLFDTSILSTQAAGFAGAAFDGRYLYFAPNANGTLVRFDTTASFTDTAAWTAFDVTKVSTGATGFFGAIFDGRYVYLVPNVGTMVLRFDAKTPASMPPGYSGSFL